ncbi:hypothetical protein [Nocardia bovistercoris]|uniref:Uncharacterized protein n=1 Tax=Nocardia bovistercoris TaxID=2785916 RepID=A0A931I7W6_9NOCA|nr:hypothetical protein [Nocardia bovistercoris]MBH0775015.1 hypothetical protein [Nocardia bovistercoris]
MADTAWSTARLPASPSAAPTVPAAPTSTVALPSAPTSSVSGRDIPTIPPFITATLTGAGTLLTSTKASAVLPMTAGAVGLLTAVAGPRPSVPAAFADTGTTKGAVAGGNSTKLLVAAPLGAIGRATTTNALSDSVGELSAAVTPHASAKPAFYAMSTSTASVTLPPTPVTAPLTGTGNLTAAVVPGFRPSGMNKSGTQTGPNAQNTWVQVVGWTADTTSYPGSTVTTNALVSLGAKASATVAANVSWTPSGSSNSISARLKKNGTVIATGSAASPAVVSTTVAVAENDLITLEVSDSYGLAGIAQATINASGTYIRIT